MSDRLPLCCRPQAYELLVSQIPAIESSDALLYSAIAISMHQNTAVDAAAIDRILQGYTDTVRARVRGSQPQALMAHLHQFLFEQEKFAGNSDDYYNPANSCLESVLRTKLGLPITLCLIYKTVAERLGFRAWGVGLPGHFLVGVDLDGSPVLVDPFASGRLLTVPEAEQRMRNTFGPEADWSDDLLQPASNRHWLTRMLQNLLNIYGSANRYRDAAAMLELEILLWPEHFSLQRDLALVLARLGLSQPASIWLNRYLKSNPDDPQSDDLKQLLEVLTA